MANLNPPPTDVALTNPLTITALSTGTPSGGSCTITWTTNRAASDRVQYGVSPNMDQTTQEANTGGSGVTSHSVTLTGLTAGKQYRFLAVSRQDSGKDGMNRTSLQNGYSVSALGEFGAA